MDLFGKAQGRKEGSMSKLRQPEPFTADMTVRRCDRFPTLHQFYTNSGDRHIYRFSQEPVPIALTPREARKYNRGICPDCPTTYSCPSCGRQSSVRQGVLTHFLRELEGHDNNADAHNRWATEKGISVKNTLFGGEPDVEGLPSSDLTTLKEVLYTILDRQD